MCLCGYFQVPTSVFQIPCIWKWYQNHINGETTASAPANEKFVIFILFLYCSFVIIIISCARQWMNIIYYSSNLPFGLALVCLCRCLMVVVVRFALLYNSFFSDSFLLFFQLCVNRASVLTTFLLSARVCHRSQINTESTLFIQ